jgi:hypothetical protein
MRWRDILHMFSQYLQGEEAFLDVCKIPYVDKLYPFVWSSSTLQSVAEELESHDVHDSHHVVYHLEASCVMPGGVVALIFAPDETKLTFQILQHGELALHLEMLSSQMSTVGGRFDDFRLGVMSFATRDSHDAAKRGDVTTLGMWSERGKRFGSCEYNAKDMCDLYGGLTAVDDRWDTDDVRPIWDVAEWDKETGRDEDTVNLDLVRALADGFREEY